MSHFKSIGEFKLEFKTLISGQNWRFFSHVTLKFDGWSSKTIGHIFYTMLSFVHHFKSIGEFKLELHQRMLNWGHNGRFFVWFDLEIWRITLKTIGTSFTLPQALCIISWPPMNSNWSYSLETHNLGQNRLFWSLMWPWNLTDDLRATPLYHYRLCASCSSHRWIKTGVIVWKFPIWVKIAEYL